MSILLETLCGNQLCHFLLLLIFILKMCHCSIYKLTYSLFREKLTCAKTSAACFLYGNGNSGWLISFKTK